MKICLEGSVPGSVLQAAEQHIKRPTHSMTIATKQPIDRVPSGSGLRLLPGIVQVHIATLLMGASVVYASWIDLSVSMVGFGRSVFSAAALFIVLMCLKTKIRNAVSGYSLLSGVFLALYWIVFFKAVEVSTVAIAIFSFSCCPILTALIESKIYREKLKPASIAGAIVVAIGLVIVSGVHQQSLNYPQGVSLGVLSGLIYSLLLVTNRKISASHSLLATTLVQHVTAGIVLLPLVFFQIGDVSSLQWGHLFVLGFVFTAMAHSMVISSLRSIKATTAGLITGGLEPIYVLIFAIVLLGQIPDVYELIGGFIILMAVTGVSAHQWKIAQQPVFSDLDDKPYRASSEVPVSLAVFELRKDF